MSGGKQQVSRAWEWIPGWHKYPVAALVEKVMIATKLIHILKCVFSFSQLSRGDKTH